MPAKRRARAKTTLHSRDTNHGSEIRSPALPLFGWLQRRLSYDSNLPPKDPDDLGIISLSELVPLSYLTMGYLTSRAGSMVKATGSEKGPRPAPVRAQARTL